MAPRPTVAPRGQVAIPPEVREQIKAMYNLKGGISGFSKRAGIKSDTLRLAMKRGTTTERTLARVKRAIEKVGLPALAGGKVAAATALTTAAVPAVPAATVSAKSQPGAALAQVGQLPPSVLRQVQRVSSALLDGMQLMQLTVLKALQEELTDGPVFPPAPRTRSR